MVHVNLTLRRADGSSEWTFYEGDLEPGEITSLLTLCLQLTAERDGVLLVLTTSRVPPGN